MSGSKNFKYKGHASEILDPIIFSDYEIKSLKHGNGDLPVFPEEVEFFLDEEYSGSGSEGYARVDISVEFEQKKILLNDIDRILSVLKKKAFKYKFTPCIGRSHGIHRRKCVRRFAVKGVARQGFACSHQRGVQGAHF